jgi:TPR repeat protein
MDIAAIRKALREQYEEGRCVGNGPAPPAGLLPRETVEKRLWPDALALYKTDLIFRGVTDLAIVGSLVLAFSVSFENPVHLVARAVTAASSHIASLIARGQPEAKSPGGIGVGEVARMSFKEVPRLDVVASRFFGPSVDVISRAQAALDAGRIGEARTLLGMLDQAQPATQYAQAVASLLSPGLDPLVDALKRLRKAADQAFAPAFTLTGVLELRMVEAYDGGRIPKSALKVVDATATARGASADEMRGDAFLWLERGAALGDAAAMRALGMAQAQGLMGKPNLQAALAHFRDAASRGDAPSQTELGRLYAFGAGVVADPAEAERWLSAASQQGYVIADAYLAYILGTKAGGKDVEIANAAQAAAERATGDKAPTDIRAFAHDTLAMFFLHVAPESMRSVEKAVYHMQQAFALGSVGAALDLANAYRLGLGVEKNPRLAYSYMLIGEKAGLRERAQVLKQQIAADLKPGDVTAAKPIAEQLVDPPRRDSGKIVPWTPPQAFVSPAKKLN